MNFWREKRRKKRKSRGKIKQQVPFDALFLLSFQNFNFDKIQYLFLWKIKNLCINEKAGFMGNRRDKAIQNYDEK